ncbi:MAG: hypothetical protein DWH97_09425 [Planctomycetota bacterium]|nr:MAG: hypothetical protein DWH97_09425 [Planctomycetota bacterium]
MALALHERSDLLHELSDLLPGKIHVTVPRSFRKRSARSLAVGKCFAGITADKFEKSGPLAFLPAGCDPKSTSKSKPHSGAPPN